MARHLLGTTVVLLTAIIVTTEQTALRDEAEPVKLSVYYESLCPDSIRFVTNQLSVTYPIYKDIMDVDIFAYGKSVDLPNDQGGYAFICQHGPEECAGNKMLACAKNYITDQDTYVEFNICVMTSDDPPTSGEACAEQLGISYEEIEPCSTNVEGEQYLHDIGVITHSLDPALNYVPWMVLDGEHTDEIQQQAEFNLTNFVCSEYTGTTPDTCP